MNEEIESLYALLGIKPDEPSAADAVSTLIKTIQSKLKSSIYGGKDGVITLPATIEGTYKNGKEIEKEIKDAYAAIYNKAKEMADESVSLTLKDIEDFQKQVNKFGKMTASKTGNDVIANARNNVNQMLSDYREFVNELKGEVAKVQKAQTKQAQKAKAQQKAKTKKSSYFDISDEEINDAIAKENARQAKIKAWRDKQAEQVASRLGYRSGSIDASRTNKKDAMASEFSEYSSQWARELAKTIKETYSKELTKHIFDKEFKSDQPKGRMSRKTTKEEYLNHLSTKAIKELGGLIGKVEHGSEDVTFDQIVEAIGLIRTIFEENGKSMSVIAQSISTTVQSRYDQPQDTQPDNHGDRKKIYKKDNYGNRIGGIDAEEGTDRGVGVGHAQAQEYQRAIQQLLKKMLGEVEDISGQEAQANKVSAKMTSSFEQYKAQAKNSKAATDTKALAQEVKGEKARDNKEYIQAVRESSREGAADTAEAQKNQQLIDETVNNANTGTDSEAGKNEIIKAIKETKKEKTEFPAEQVKNVLANLGQTKQTDGKCPCQAILEGIRDAVQSINSKIQGKVGKAPTKHYVKKKGGGSSENGGDNGAIHLMSEEMKRMPIAIQKALAKTGPKAIQTTMSKALVPIANTEKTLKDVINGVSKTDLNNRRLTELNEKTATMAEDRNKMKRASQDEVVKPITEDKAPEKKYSKLFANVIKDAFSGGTAVDKIMSSTAEEQSRLRAERIKKYGLNRGRDLTDTGDISQIRRTKELFGWNYKSDKNNKNLFQDVQFTPHVDIDTKAIMASLNKVLSGSEMFKAQTGGTLRNIIGSMTGYIGMPSLEKSRAEAEGLNQVMANVRNEVLKLVQEIQSKELTLHGMENNGEATFTNDGRITEGSSSASKKLFADLEEQKGVLRGVLAEVAMVDQVVGQTGGKVHDIIKNLGFVMPELMQNNTIIKNINDGLDKNGKALKFQTRTAEILNYSFQLMSRSIGQMIKNWIAMMNPLSLIKRAFQDFTSYDVKWQRTMNVIKYNLRRIIRPFMEWIAQQLVNIIGLVNALMKGIGKAFGKNWDLFDQSAASAEQMREELEQAANVTASFDELHDIGTESSNNPPMDLMGDIYTPQWNDIYQNIENFGKKIGDVLAGIRKFTEGWNFWTWLAVIGGALIGLKVLKWLISLFGKGKNPLQSVADGLSFLEKAVGWALLIWAFTEFTKALTGFVECMKTADWEDIAKSLLTLGGAFAELVGSIILLEWGSLGVDPKAMVGLASLVWVFGEFVKAIIPFIELMWSICDLNDEGKEFEILAGSLSMLALSFVELIAGVAGMEKLTQLIGLDWQSLFGLAAVVGVFDLFVKALVPFIETISQIEGDKWDTIIPMIVGLGGAFIALAAGVATVSKFFTAMDWKAIGQLYVVAGAFEVFMFALIPFVNAIKDIPFETLAGGTILIAGAFMALGTAIAIMAPALTMLNWSSLAMGIILMTAMAGIVWVLGEFVKSLQGLTSEQLLSGLALLAGAIITISVAIGILAAVFTTLVTTGIGAIAIVLLGAVLGVIALIIVALTDFVRALGEAGEGIKLICEGIALVIQSIGVVIIGIVTAIATGIATIITSIAEGITAVLQPIMDFMDSVIGKVVELSTTIVKEIGETIRTVIKTVGDVVLGIIDKIVNAIPNLLKSIVDFCYNIGPAIENSVDAICRSVTKLVNFVVSAVEYMANLVIGAINKISIQIPDWVPGIGGQKWGFNLEKIDIPRFVPKYEQGTNYVPNDGLAYLHQGEAVVPKKYNTPYQPDNSGMSSAIDRLAQQVARISVKVEQGIPVKGQFVQRGSDLVATVEKANNRMKNNILNNKVYAR